MPDSEQKEDSQERFGRYAGRYVTSRSHAEGVDLDRLVAMAAPRPDWILLDVASGGGHTALKFAPLVAKVIATDITPNMLAAARRFITSRGVANVAFGFADGHELPFAQGVFDLVTCRIAPHHFRDPGRFIQEGYRVLKPGGTLLVQDHLLPEDEETGIYIDDFERRRDPSHNRAFSRSAWVGMFAAAGLAVEQVEEVPKRHALLPWAQRQGCSPEAINELRRRLAEAPPIAAGWFQTEQVEGPNSTFVNHHILISGRK